eukprot:6295050-Prymnesium_polylepis.1
MQRRVREGMVAVWAVQRAWGRLQSRAPNCIRCSKLARISVACPVNTAVNQDVGSCQWCFCGDPN